MCRSLAKNQDKGVFAPVIRQDTSARSILGLNCRCNSWASALRQLAVEQFLRTAGPRPHILDSSDRAVTEGKSHENAHALVL